MDEFLLLSLKKRDDDLESCLDLLELKMLVATAAGRQASQYGGPQFSKSLSIID